MSGLLILDPNKKILREDWIAYYGSIVGFDQYADSVGDEHPGRIF